MEIKKVKIKMILQDQSILTCFERDFHHLQFELSPDYSYQEADIILSDTCSLENLRGEECCELQSEAHKLIAITDATTNEEVIQVVANCNIYHLISKRGAYLKSELLKTVEQIVLYGGCSFEQLIGKAADSEILIINDTQDIDKKIESILESLHLEEFFDSPMNYVQTILNELATNAIYNAPTQNNEQIYKERDRTEKVKLPDGESVIVRVGMVDKHIIVSVKDPYGSLTKNRVVESLKRSIEEAGKPENKNGGAGLGLFLSYGYSNQIIFNVEQGKATEIISIIECTKRYKNFRERVTSFHFFEK